MKIEYDPAKRQTTLEARGLDMAQAGEVFEDARITVEDDRRDYGETRNITIGFLGGRMVVVAWTPRGTSHRVISMRKANDREQKTYGPVLGR
ncbi:BrnT family toxin [Roseobacter sp. HKCCD9010]|uniref:BrnT family toxin n=2 Tax=unclassified Roseobacter TaxID=196798 RepID=UPI001491F8F5|nr:MULTISPECIES: BrnT family toxin [unclassified Roseobacter]MBF9052434.1 BrnT family toxin [Rhodobacterales bacterium HKCCD4356]NNV14413.1 BrnT family toxin [Roseobacter sp. HKCCD7357]NNV18601.1 BrnT family toxin [Roseobacter sp. HKCCD8768]NNV28054.1 BrnT family toxin [Roseobacter sp. HKCCD8192]NNV32369.1 BrnT family toxin [Roseobacter sp. HKCCD9061]NNV36660.1 BrnT family toxin [Roseobacter sp. HKCCD9073]NNV45124.1 BrnT family toxin [Roseobacter sp. HKCCD6497]NNV53648.1 BrnT family toxin [